MPNRKMLLAIAMLLIFALAFSAAIPLGAAALNIDTFAFIYVRPGVVGVGQPVLVVMWLSNVPTTEYYEAPYVGEDRQWHNYKLHVTKPDGTTEVFGPFGSGSAGTTFTHYTPTAVGTYKLRFEYPGEGPTQRGNYVKPSSAETTLVVQQEEVSMWTVSPLPAGYWGRPISADLREWTVLAGNWLLSSGISTYFGAASSGFGQMADAYATAPNSSHILWTRQFIDAGIIGGETAGTASASLAGTAAGFSPPVIMMGRLYYNWYQGLAMTTISGLAKTLRGFSCVDLRTGETLWENPAGAIDGGELRMASDNSITTWLWEFGDTYNLYNALTGKLVRQFTNASTGHTVVGSRGNTLVYILSGARNWLACWNSSKASTSAGTGPWSAGIQWNVTVTDVPGTPTLRYVIAEDTALAECTDFVYNTEPATFTHVAYNLKPGNEGRLLWAKNRTDIGDFARRGMTGSSVPTMNDGYYSVYKRETLENIVYDYNTGIELYRTDPIGTEGTEVWDIYKSGASIAYGKLYYSGYGGRLRAYDIKTGDHLWTYYVGDTGYNTPYGTTPFYGGQVVADGKIFIGTAEHSVTQPLWHGARLHAIDAETGEGVWNITGMFQTLGIAVADGYLTGMNAYDGQIYCFGKGGSATTVTASPKVSEHGNSVLIEGIVTDESPGTKQHNLAVRYPNGVPAVSDKDMTVWMEHLYMQKECPTDVTGVEVVLSVLDANGNCREIGRATSDSSGFYSFAWIPDIPGKYTVYASFEGSKAYWSSEATTAFVVDEAPLEPAEPEPEPPSVADTYFIPAVAGFAVAFIVIIVLLALLLLKKRP